MNEETNEVVALFHKISEFRKKINALDWNDDKVFVNQNNPQNTYTYLSELKLKNNIKGVLPEVGLEWTLDYSDVQVLDAVGSMRCHFMVRGVMRLIDIDTGYSQSYTAFGEAADSGDKALRKAQTSALKSIMDNNFHISDRAVEPDGEQHAGFTSPQERETIIESMQDKLVEPNKPAEAPQPAQEPPKSEIPTQTQFEVEEPVTRSISPLQEKAISKLLENFEKAVDRGDRTEQEFDQCRYDANNIRTASDAAAFLKTWKV